MSLLNTNLFHLITYANLFRSFSANSASYRFKRPIYLMKNEKNVKIFKENADQAMNKAYEIGMKLHYPKTFDIPPVKLVQITIK